MRSVLGPEGADHVLLSAWSASDEPGLDTITPADFVARILNAIPTDDGSMDQDQVRAIFEGRNFPMPD